MFLLTLSMNSTDVKALVPTESTFFATAFIEESDVYNTLSDGDLWPCAWSNDDVLYLANGDGKGFDLNGVWADIVVNKITSGHPDTANLAGQKIAVNVGQVWGNPAIYNRKPTGLVSDNGVLWLAVQDLNKSAGAKFFGPAFNDAPNATILKSTNRGLTWTWNTAAPMFKNYIFTTVMFLDWGKDGVDQIPGSTVDDWIYAYGTDYNWRDSFNNAVPDPNKLYLARIARGSDIQNINNWQFWTGNMDGGTESWSTGGNISAKMPILQDDRKVYPNILFNFPSGHIYNMSEVSQGSITYNKPLNRYIYCSWTEYTFEFFEAPKPWGPWKKFISKDFGSYGSPWTDTKNGGYTTVMPSKYISADGKIMWFNANTFESGSVTNYRFSLRRLFVQPYTGELANNTYSSTNNLAQTGESRTPIAKGSYHQGNQWATNDGIKNVNTDSWSGEAKTEDYWGYTWSKIYNLNKVVYTTGGSFGDGGWFNNLRVQVRRNFVWYDVGGSCSPAYPNNGTANPFKTYTFTFPDTTGDGVRIIGTPGGTATFTTISELEVYYAPVVVIKDNDAGAPVYSETGAWTASSGIGYNGGTYRYSSVGGANTATWNLNLPQTRAWKISVLYKAGTNRATSAKYIIKTASGDQTVFVNQSLNDLTWVTLGTWNFNAGSGIIIVDAAGSTPAGKVVIADAVRAEPQ